jgi:hypothetical protein
MAKRQHLHGGADLDAASACGDGAGDGERRGQDGARRLLVDLGEPDRVEPPSLGVRDLLERLRKRIGVRLLIHLAVEFVIPAELHGRFLRCWGTVDRVLASAKC